MTFRLILACLLLACTLPAAALDIPPDFKARYHLEKYGTSIGDVRLSLTSEADQLLYSSHTEPRGLAAMFSSDEVNETSRLNAADRKHMPKLLNYTYTRKGKAKKNQHFDITYQRDGRISISSGRGDIRVQPSQGDRVWDRLSVQIALACDASESPREKQVYHYQVFDYGELEDYAFEYIGEESVKVAGKNYLTRKFVRHHGKRDTHFWLAEELHYLPVKMQQYKDGDLHISMYLDRIEL